MQNRLKSPVVWSCVLAQIVLIIAVFLPDISDTVKLIGGAIIEICTLFGLLNNPTNPSGF